MVMLPMSTNQQQHGQPTKPDKRHAAAMATTDKKNQVELIALVHWLQTFPEFGGLKIVDAQTGTTEFDTVLSALASVEASRAIATVAQLLCEDCSYQILDSTNATNSDQIWTSLLILSSTSRPVKAEGNDGPTNPRDKMSAADLKHFVLSHLLLRAIQSKKLRIYVERIVQLPMGTQKALKSIIEWGGVSFGNKSSSSKSPGTMGGSSKRRPAPTDISALAGTSSQKLKNHVGMYQSTPGQLSTPQSVLRTPSSRDHLAARLAATPPYGLSSTQGAESYNRSDADTPVARSSVQFSTPHPRERCNHRYSANSLLTTPQQMLSPATLSSPDQIQSIVNDLKGKNQKFQSMMGTYKDREEQLQQKIKDQAAAHRLEMMKTESRALENQRQLEEDYEARAAALREKLQKAEAAVAAKGIIERDLQKAKDQLEVFEHSKTELQDCQEMLRHYKGKVADLQDKADLVEQQQEAISLATEEIVKLENQVRALKPAARQLQEYKERAVEAEVKLVANQDFIRRMEQKANIQSDQNRELWDGVIMQQEQMEELQQRIKCESADDDRGGGGIGVGMSEFNTHIQSELKLLRNENEQLREFYEARQDDAVQKLEAKVDDSGRLMEEYKGNFLRTKEQLEVTQSELHRTQKRLEDTQSVLANTQKSEADTVLQLKKSEEHVEELQEECAHHVQKIVDAKETLQRTERKLEESEMANADLRRSIQAYIEKTEAARQQSKQKQASLDECISELETTINALEEAHQQLNGLNASIKSWEGRCKQLESELESTHQDLSKTQETLSRARDSLDQGRNRERRLEQSLKKLKQEKCDLEVTLEEQRRSHQDEIKEAHNSLEETREVLNARATKEKNELQANMNKLLEDERKSSRNSKEEASKRYAELDEDWRRQFNELEEQSKAALEASRKEKTQCMARIRAEHREELETVKQRAAQKRSSLVAEHAQELETVKQRAEQDKNDIITKGKNMLAEKKQKYERDLWQKDEVCHELEDGLRASQEEAQEKQSLLRNQVSELEEKAQSLSCEVNELTTENEDLNDRNRRLQKDIFVLKEENDKIRRQAGGRDGALQSHNEALQKEFNEVVEENRRLKGDLKQRPCSSSSHETTSELGPVSYTGGRQRTSIQQMRQDYEEQLDQVVNEKRELVMKNASLVSESNKSYKQLKEKEQQLAQIQKEMTSMRLALERKELASETTASPSLHHPHGISSIGSNHGAGVADLLSENESSPKEISFVTRSFQENRGATGMKTTPERLLRSGANDSPTPTNRRSPRVERAMNLRAQNEYAFRKSLSSFQSSMQPPAFIDGRNTHQYQHGGPAASIATRETEPTAASSSLSTQQGRTSAATRPFEESSPAPSLSSLDMSSANGSTGQTEQLLSHQQHQHHQCPDMLLKHTSHQKPLAPTRKHEQAANKPSFLSGRVFTGTNGSGHLGGPSVRTTNGNRFIAASSNSGKREPTASVFTMAADSSREFVSGSSSTSLLFGPSEQQQRLQRLHNTSGNPNTSRRQLVDVHEHHESTYTTTKLSSLI